MIKKPSIQSQAVLTHDIFDDIRAGYRFVAERAKFVRIREDRLMEYAVSLQPRPPSNTLDTDRHFTSDDPEILAAYILCLEAVNFGSGYEDDLVRDGWPRLDESLYYTVSTALKQSFENDGTWTTARIAQMSDNDMHRIFHLPHTATGRELAVLFVNSLKELGVFIDAQFDGNFMGLIDEAQGLAGNLVTRLAALPGFADVTVYEGRDIRILKRAQITAADLQLAFLRLGRTLFSDIDHLTIFADCGLPHVLHLDGVLDLHPDLAAKILAGRELIPAGSEEEIELRCCAAEAVERLAAIKGMRVVDLDHLLWHRSVEDAKYKATPAHRTRTRFY